MTTLKFAFQSETGRRVVEVFDNNGRYVATIEPDNAMDGIKIGSFHIAGVERDNHPAPAVIVTFKRGGA